VGSMKNIAVYGGTFNPIHNGHIIAVTKIMESELFDEIHLMPAGIPPYKPEEKKSLPHRLNMARQVVRSIEGLVLNELEAKRDSSSTTFDTLTILHKNFPDTRFHWCIGYDHLFSIEKWYRGHELLEQFSLVVLNRGGFEQEQARIRISEIESKYNAHITAISMPEIEISSTDIRERVAKNKSIYGFTPESIIDYIENNGLYKE